MARLNKFLIIVFFLFFTMLVYYITLNWKSFPSLTKHYDGSMCHVKAFFQQVLD